MCEIIPELDGNVSDHLPLRMLFTLDVNIPMKAAKIQQDEALARPLWGDTKRKNKYRDILQKNLKISLSLKFTSSLISKPNKNY